MISFVFLVLAAAAVLSVYTVIGRLAIPPEDRVPLRELGWDGWVHTLRRSLAFLGDRAPGVGAVRGSDGPALASAAHPSAVGHGEVIGRRSEEV
ncbi:hypothetical protein [Kocuria aegyptia]|uniref:Uncharacterized protein n=1 Tax=Kocuria aegyptia TaxID=330943 RepID=A0ABP4WWC3_9MICC